MGRDRSDSSGFSGNDFGDKNKKVKINKSSAVENDDTAEWKVVITFNKEGTHYHPLKRTKAIEKETGKIKFGKYLSNSRLFNFAAYQSQRKRILS